MSTSALTTDPTGQLALFDIPSRAFRVPDVRRDCSFKLAVLYRETCLHDDGEGSYAGNKYLATKYLKCHPSSVRDYYAMLEDCQLVERRIEHGRERHARPLVPLQDLFTLWPELAFACSTCKRVEGLLRAAAREAIKKIKGTMARYRSVRKPTSEALPVASISQELRASAAPNSAPLSSLQGGRADETSTNSGAKAKPKTTTYPKTEERVSVVDVSLAEISAPLVEALGEAPARPLTTLAQKLGRTASHVRQCVRAAKAKPDVLNLGAYLRRLIEAPEGSVMPPAGPAHAKDVSTYRPIDVIAAPKQSPERLAWEAEKQAQKAREEAQRAAWEALSEPGRGVWIDRALAELLAAERVSSVRQRMQSERGEHHRVKATAQRLFNENIPASEEAS